MKKNILIILFIITQLIGCKENIETPSEIITLDSSIENGIKGFDFQTGKIIKYPNSDNIKPDLMVLVQMNSTEGLIGPYFTNIDLTQTFTLTDSFDDKETAEKYFDSYTSISSGIYDSAALNLKPYQIWTIKTNGKKFVKLLVLETMVGKDINEPYAEVTFRWYYLE